MGMERRRAPRWRAASHHHKVRVRHADGRKSLGSIVDVSHSGIGLRDSRHHFQVGMRVSLEIDLFGEVVEVQGVVRFVDRFYPRIGLHIDSPGLMEKLVGQATSCGFVNSEVKGDTLVVSGSLTLVALKEFDAIRGYRKLDLSAVHEVSVAGAGIVFSIARTKAKVDCCSEAIAPMFDFLGICKANVCVSKTPCNLSKKWRVPAKPADEAGD